MKTGFKTERKDWIFIVPTTSVWLASLIITAWDYYKLQKAHSFDPLNLLGLTLFIVGLIKRFIGKRNLGENYSYGLRPPPRLVKHGLYKHIRHPIYLAMILYTLGTPLIFSSSYGFLTALGLVPLTLYRVSIEEKMLVSEFGDEYREYMKKTKKLIPFIY